MRYFIERRVSAAVRDKDCDCRVSVRAQSGKDQRLVSARKCSGKHGDVVKKLHKIAESEVEQMLSKGL